MMAMLFQASLAVLALSFAVWWFIGAVKRDNANRAEWEAWYAELDRRRRLFSDLASDGKTWWWKTKGGNQ